MKIEHSVYVLPLDNSLKAAVEALEKDGWRMRPDVPAVAVYHVWRSEGDQKPAPVASSVTIGDLKVNDELIMVLGADGKHKQ